MIKPIQYSDLERCVSVIREGFSGIAEEYNLTKENCPTHTSFITKQNLQYHWDNGFLMYGVFVDDSIIGYVSLENKGNEVFELRNLAVLPEYRHNGYGKQLLDFCKEVVKESGGSKITIGIIEDNIVLKEWYAVNGFVHTGTKRFEHLPFTAGYMECAVR